ncbi:hypothetical protein VNO77_34049 [Canavalia gladiata]|uniref:Uncharacterized protein n=1 Tax=Canavalia gladiata TaxID=3824 RepID=A0AAN9PZH3_CANGL
MQVKEGSVSLLGVVIAAVLRMSLFLFLSFFIFVSKYPSLYQFFLHFNVTKLEWSRGRSFWNLLYSF